MAATVVPHKSCMVGFALQDGLGLVEATAETVFPLPDGTDFGPKYTKEVYQNNQGNYDLSHYFINGYEAGGSLKIPLVPGMLTSSHNLYKWLFERSSEATYYQGNYATLFFYYGNDFYVRYADVKCTGGSFDVQKGSPVYMNATALGGGEPDHTITSTCFPAYSSAVWFDGTPYHGDSASIYLGPSASYTIDAFTKNHTLTWDNKVMSAGDAGTLVAGRLGPYALPNVARAGWTGTFSRWFVDTNMPDAWGSTTWEGTYYMRLSQGANALWLNFPRIIFTDGIYPKIPGDGIVVNDGISFTALGVLGKPGASCFTITES